ncbi:MAG TPA: tannase/feruloyl esterase family alpha/beta hydrolase [Methylomirabilota bacterium]|nr:tannase/feruloyl esterase family alpha/beta hydrolase [Methylomirabilota bacterium]
MRRSSVVVTVMTSTLGALVASMSAVADEAACAALAEPGKFANTSIAATTAFTATGDSPAYCEVTATISPVEGSHIGVVYRLPEDWNGKVLGLGGGGFSGNTGLRDAAQGLRRGYATMQTDTGHKLPTSPAEVMDASWTSTDGVFNWAPLEDFGHRAIHLMTMVGKDVAAAYYGRRHELAYYQGCSTGGRQGMMESQRYPDDYDGIIAGAPVYDTTVQTSGFVRGQLVADPERAIGPAQAAALNAAMLAACDGLDGAEDQVITDIDVCRFDPSTLLCPAGRASDACLTEPQIDMVRERYTGVRLADGRVAMYESTPGSETAWVPLGGQVDPAASQEKFAAVFLGEFGVDPMQLTPEQIVEKVTSTRMHEIYSANDPDLSAFAARGGKLILYPGMLDAVANPPATIDYYDNALATTGPKIDGEVTDFARLFLMPGVGHCIGGPGPSAADWLGALEAWVAHGEAPDQIMARRIALPFEPAPAEPAPERVRPLCPYPALARYVDGDVNAPESFRCE